MVEILLQLTTSTRRSTPYPTGFPAPSSTSTHDLHTEVDKKKGGIQMLDVVLQLTTSTRRSTHSGAPEKSTRPLQLTTSTRRSTLEIQYGICCNNTSTHDLHTEVDSNFSQNRQEHSITFTALFLSNPLSHPFPPPFLCLAATFSSLFLVRIPRDFLFTSHSH